MPKVNSIVKTPDGEGKVMYNDLLKQIVTVRFEDEDSSEIKEYNVSELEVKDKK